MVWVRQTDVFRRRPERVRVAFPADGPASTATSARSESLPDEPPRGPSGRGSRKLFPVPCAANAGPATNPIAAKRCSRFGLEASARTPFNLGERMENAMARRFGLWQFHPR